MKEAVLGGCLEEVCLCKTSVGKIQHKATRSHPSQFRPPKRSPSRSLEVVHVASHSEKESASGSTLGTPQWQFVLGYAGGPGVMTRVLQRGVQGARVREGKVRTETGQSRAKIEGTSHGTWVLWELETQESRFSPRNSRRGQLGRQLDSRRS